MSLKDFQIICKLGEGAFAQVYKVHRYSDKKYYAMKTIKFNRLTLKEKENVLTEIHFLACLKSPYIVEYKDSFIDEKSSTLYIIMEYCPGGDFLSKIRGLKPQQYIDEIQIWKYAIQLIQGLKYLHDLSISHRDFKSANIFLSKDNSIVKVGDLGVSKIAENGLLQTQTGTPYYCSPEVWSNKPYNFKSDIWSLGCVLYEMAQQTTPFKGQNMEIIFNKVQSGEYQRLNERYSQDLQKIICMCLQVNPKNRYSANQLMETEEIKQRIYLFQQQQQVKEENILEQKSLLLKEFKDVASLKDLKKLKAFLPPCQYQNNQISCCLLGNYDNPQQEEVKRYNSNNIYKDLVQSIDYNQQYQFNLQQQIQLYKKTQQKQTKSEFNLDIYLMKQKYKKIIYPNQYSQQQQQYKLPPIQKKIICVQKNIINK
ncbi:protein kinase domain protein [Ichthyophthirius multifiliis]|uniref:non-specific serine/threonine protein kinase n=1 Tax=Ichthyophthirius multifiliis TaxID=5932 RepID=G0QS34_ICHMU|nr:protein kinase domain protein [Ichthyophthirius multifiliis]EGR31976.1 protein kinase domain protein [Ichthyophthirius multifiliis]|eukprot:XP_004035462.1 protein kinase domain protein [Ichthyophthirius multifiliis]